MFSSLYGQLVQLKCRGPRSVRESHYVILSIMHIDTRHIQCIILTSHVINGKQDAVNLNQKLLMHLKRACFLLINKLYVFHTSYMYADIECNTYSHNESSKPIMLYKKKGRAILMYNIYISATNASTFVICKRSKKVTIVVTLSNRSNLIL